MGGVSTKGLTEAATQGLSSKNVRQQIAKPFRQIGSQARRSLQDVGDFFSPEPVDPGEPPPPIPVPVEDEQADEEARRRARRRRGFASTIKTGSLVPPQRGKQVLG